MLSRQYTGPNYTVEELNTLANLFARTFISRPDVKAFQKADGSWYPVRESITREDLHKHLLGKSSMGHYLTGTDAKVKFFAFDIDLEEAKPPGKSTTWPEGRYYPMPQGNLISGEQPVGWQNFQPDDPRGIWEAGTQFMAPYQHSFLIHQMRTMAQLLARTSEDMFGYRTLVTYSGHKGMHVYVILDEKAEGCDAREAAMMVLQQTDRFELLRGKNFFKHRVMHNDPEKDMPQLSVEIFPKQDSLDVTDKKLGNLMRLPLGRNLRIPDGVEHYLPQFIDVRHRITEFKERNPIEAMTVSNQWTGVMTE